MTGRIIPLPQIREKRDDNGNRYFVHTPKCNCELCVKARDEQCLAAFCNNRARPFSLFCALHAPTLRKPQ